MLDRYTILRHAILSSIDCGNFVEHGCASELLRDVRLRRLGRLWLPLLSLELRLRGGLRLSSLRGYLLDCKRLLGGLTQQLLSLSLGCRSLRRIRGLAEGVKASDRRILLLFFLPLSFKLGFLSASQLSLLLLPPYRRGNTS